MTAASDISDPSRERAPVTGIDKTQIARHVAVASTRTGGEFRRMRGTGATGAIGSGGPVR